MQVRHTKLGEAEQIVVNDKEFPKVYELSSECTLEECCEWVKTNKNSLERDLIDHGAFVFRGFPIKEIPQFHDFMLSFGWDHSAKFVGGGGPRNIVMGHIYNSTDSPPEFKIPFHHEMAYLSTFPDKLIFYCDIEPSENGETPILLSNELIKSIQKKNPAFIKSLKDKGVRYIRILCNKKIGGESLKYQKSWQDIFETEDTYCAEESAKKCGTETIEWLDDGSMKLTTIKFDGVVNEKRTQKEIWFNAICLLHPAVHKGKNTPWDVIYGDYSRMNDEDVLQALDIMQSMGVMPKWKKGDMMVVDNHLALHSRNIFTPPRRILAAFA